MRRKSKPEVTTVEVPAGPYNVAVKRVAPILRHWAAFGTMDMERHEFRFDLRDLCASAYLQGVMDGTKVAESESYKRMIAELEQPDREPEVLGLA